MSIIIALFLALNMGLSGFAVAFAPSFGSGIVSFRKAGILFTVLVIIGAVLLSGRVSKTLGVKLLNGQAIDQIGGMIILIAAGTTIFISNILKIPQSTSVVTVAAIAGVGVYFGSLNLIILERIIIFWVLMSLAAYTISFFLMEYLYPPTNKNMHLYEKILAKNKIMRKITLYINSYNAVGIGTNNVANVVAPIVSMGLLSVNSGITLFAPFFGIGALLFGKQIINKTGKELVPLGSVAGLIVSLVSTTMIFVSSLLAMPAPYVQYSMMSILGVHTRKNSLAETFGHNYTKKLVAIWVISPVIAFLISYLLNFGIRSIL